MNRKLTAMGLSLFAACTLGIFGSSHALADEYEAEDLTIQVGSDASELKFNWFTTDSTEPSLIICKADDLVDGTCPETATYTAQIKTVVVEAESSGGNPGGGPGGGRDAESTQDVETLDDEDVSTYACKVTADTLEADTEYAYFIGYGDTLTDMSIVTLKSSDNYNFIFVGDPQIGASRDEDSDTEGWVTTVDSALTKFEDTSFILSAGDQVESSSSDTQYTGFFSAEELVSMPIMPANGNHDKGIRYQHHFNVPNESEYGQVSTTLEDETTVAYGGDYWFKYGKVLFMVLNTNNSSATSHNEFMSEAIEANTDMVYKVVVFHHSLYSSARHVTDVDNLRTAMVPVMDEHGVDVVLAGHDHFYARSYPLTNFEVSDDNTNVDDDGRVVEPDGTIYFTAGSSSGSKYYDFSDIDGWTNYYLAAYNQPKEPSYLNIEVNELSYGTTLTVSSYLTASGEQIDTYTILKKDYDLNGDGAIDKKDINIVKSLRRQPASVNPAADVDNDGTITTRDARKLLLMIRAAS